MGNLLDEPKAHLSSPETLLPEFYYDLIARILPGVIFLLTMLYLVDALDPASAMASIRGVTWAPAILMVVGLGTCGYVVGIVLTPIQTAVRALYIPGIWRSILRNHHDFACERQAQLGLRNLEALLEEALKPDARRSTIEDAVRRIYAPLHDLLKVRLPQAQLVLPKMNAEAGLCDNIAAGLAVLTVVPLATMGSAGRVDAASTVTVALLLAVGALFFMVARARYEGLVRRHFAYWNLLPRDPPQPSLLDV